MGALRKYAYSLLLPIILLALSLIIYQKFPEKHVNNLAVSFLSIGQGDAIYIKAPNGRQMIVDGAPRGLLMKPLQKAMPSGNTVIDVIEVTNPDADHYAGFIDLLKTYKVGAVIESGVSSTTKTYAEFESLVKEKHIPKVIAQKGMEVVLDETNGISYDVLFPDRGTGGMTHNDASVVGKLVYGLRGVMLTGDATFKTESYLIADNPESILKSDILKVGHHGSRTSTSNAFLDAVAPVSAMISCGKNNRYGFPTKETMGRLAGHRIQVFVTKDIGTVICTTDGKEPFECVPPPT